MIPILIIDRNTSSSQNIRLELTDAKFVWGRDYMLYNGSQKVKEDVKPDFPQLLVVHYRPIDENFFSEFIVRMKEKNPQLKTAVFSPLPIGRGSYDKYIHMGVVRHTCFSLIVEMRKHLEHLSMFKMP